MVLDTEIQDLTDWMEDSLFHFSFKTINSNAPAGGVRVAKDVKLDLPYISLRTLLTESEVNIGLDYLVNANQSASKFKRVRQLLGEIPSLESDSSQNKKTIIASYDSLTQHSKTSNIQSISARLRQLIIPKNQYYVAITPLVAAGLCEYIGAISEKRQAPRKEAAKLKKTKKSEPLAEKQPKPIFPHGYDSQLNSFSIGGSNPQNAGGRVRSMSRPFVFWSIPERLTQEERGLFAIHFKGFKPVLEKSLVESYSNWLINKKTVEDKSYTANQEIKATLRVQKEEIDHLKTIIVALNQQASIKQIALIKHQKLLDSLGEDDGFEELDLLSQGWLKPHLRSPQWKQTMAQWLVKELAHYPLAINSLGDTVNLGLTQEDRRRLVRAIEEL